MTRLANLIRRLLGLFERRWIPDGLERSRHQAVVERRLPGSRKSEPIAPD
jgi:hypothetical protein